MRPLVTAAEMRRTEDEFVTAGGNVDWLMRQAGMQVASRIPADRSVLVLAGPGKNGEDALLAAETVRERGDEVRLYTYKREPGDASMTRAEDDDEAMSRLAALVSRSDVIVDGLLGIGRNRTVDGLLAKILKIVNQSGAERIAVDLPTGVDADTGAVETVAFQADLTVTLGLGKRGLWGSPGADLAGRIEIADIGFPPGSGGETSASLLDPDDIQALLPRRTADWNKGKSGRVLVVGGSRDFSGAPVLVSVAAYRSGAGLVDLAVPSAIAATVAGHTLESIFTHVPATKWLTRDCVEPIAEAAAKAEAVAIGPGIGSSPETIEFVRSILPRLGQMDIPLVLDADGLNAVATWPAWWQHVPGRMVITPHPGEMGRLLGISTAEVQSDRFASAGKAAEKFGMVIVLKGANSIIAETGQTMRVCPTGGPNLGTGGTGDVLTGIIAGYLAQGLSPLEAATAGVWVHGAAGDNVRARQGQTGTLASDLWSQIPDVRKCLLKPIGLE